jgi:recombination associated protein RdgC
MLFKNLCLYRLDEDFALDATALHERLTEQRFRPCGRLDESSSGFTPVLAHGDGQLVFERQNRMLLRLQEQSKLLPASVVKEAVDERVTQIEDSEARKVRKRERDRIKDEVLLDLLPRAFNRNRTTWGYIDRDSGWLVVDASTWNRAEAFTERLRDAVTRLPIAPPRLQQAPQSVMSRWVASGQLPGDLQLGEECVLSDPDREGAEVRAKRQDLGSPEIAAHLQAGKQVTRLALVWHERLEFLLDADFSIKRLRFPELTDDERDDEDDTPEARFEADFTLMTLEIARLLPRLTELFGGLELNR